jgi:hypothetical protein
LKKTTLILILGLLTNYLIGQEIHSQYQFKKEKTKPQILHGSVWHSIESDSLVIYENGNFYRKKYYQLHQLIYSEQKGFWKMENGILHLVINREKRSKTDINWTETHGKYKYLIKKRRIIPLNGYVGRKLKRIRK